MIAKLCAIGCAIAFCMFIKTGYAWYRHERDYRIRRKQSRSTWWNE